MEWIPITRDDLWKREVISLLTDIRNSLNTKPLEEISIDEIVDKYKKPIYKCPKCGKEFNSARALGGHVGHCKGSE